MGFAPMLAGALTGFALKGGAMAAGGKAVSSLLGKKKSPSSGAPQSAVQAPAVKPASPLGVQAMPGQAPLGIAKNGNIGGALQASQGQKSYLGQ